MKNLHCVKCLAGKFIVVVCNNKYVICNNKYVILTI